MKVEVLAEPDSKELETAVNDSIQWYQDNGYKVHDIKFATADGYCKYCAMILYEKGAI